MALEWLADEIRRATELGHSAVHDAIVARTHDDLRLLEGGIATEVARQIESAHLWQINVQQQHPWRGDLAILQGSHRQEAVRERDDADAHVLEAQLYYAAHGWRVINYHDQRRS